jgi:hypothetical protein
VTSLPAQASHNGKTRRFGPTDAGLREIGMDAVNSTLLYGFKRKETQNLALLTNGREFVLEERQ